ncbi:hypothetical protein [Paenibacillus marinisediminis]
MNMLVYFIIGCEIGFWVVILAGLFARYVWKQERLSLILFALTPLIDLALLVATAVDMKNGATATTAHGIAAIYIGISIAFGKRMISWADERFRYYVLKGPKPIRLTGTAYAKQYFGSWLLHALAFVIGQGMLWGIIYWINDSARTEALVSISTIWCTVLAIDLLISLSYFVWRRA